MKNNTVSICITKMQSWRKSGAKSRERDLKTVVFGVIFELSENLSTKEEEVNLLSGKKYKNYDINGFRLMSLY